MKSNPGYVLFTQCPQIKLKQFEDNDNRKIPLKYYLLRCCSCWEMSKTLSHKFILVSVLACKNVNQLWYFTNTCHNWFIHFYMQNNFHHTMTTETEIILWHGFTHFSKTAAPQQVMLQGKLSTIIIFKLSKLNVNLWTLCFV